MSKAMSPVDIFIKDGKDHWKDACAVISVTNDPNNSYNIMDLA